MPHVDSMHNHHEYDNEGHGSTHGPGHLPTREEFEERYAQSQQIWSGNVNATLVDEVADLRPGTALDVGCGEGADLQWLTDRGWGGTRHRLCADCCAALLGSWAARRGGRL